MRLLGGKPLNRQRLDIREGHRAIARQSLMFGGYLAGRVGESPGGICEYCLVLAPQIAKQIDDRRVVLAILHLGIIVTYLELFSQGNVSSPENV